MEGNPIAFDFSIIIAAIIPLTIYLCMIVFIIFFLMSVRNFMKKKIMLDEQKIEQTDRFIELYKSTHEIR